MKRHNTYGPQQCGSESRC